MFLDSSQVTVQGNFLGVSASGAVRLGKPYAGVYVTTFESFADVSIGGPSTGQGNAIIGTNAIFFGIGNIFEAYGNIEGNLIETDATGTRALNRDGRGIQLDNTSGVTVKGNVISGNALGIANLIGSPARDTLIQGNFIETAADGVTPLGNVGNGVSWNGGYQTTIGGDSANEANVIAFNGGDGVRIVSSVITSGHVRVARNSIFSNGTLGIDLEGNGPSLNDQSDTDTGANRLQNFPVLTSVTNSDGNTVIAGIVNSAASTIYRLEFFANNAIDPTGYGEGEIFLGSANVTTNSNGNASFHVRFPQIGAGQRVTATATDPDGNTSEFSAAIGHLLNISTRLHVQTGNNVGITGFILRGTNPKTVLIRGIGPSLARFGIQNVLPDPMLQLIQGNTLLVANDNWKDNQQAEIAATGKAPTANAEARSSKR